MSRQPPETMAQRLRRLRATKNWSYADCAKRLGVSRNAVWKWEHEESLHMRPETLLRIAEAYGTDVAYIVRGEVAHPSAALSASALSEGVKYVSEPSPETRGERLKRLRVQKGWSLRKAANRFRVSFTTVDKWEKDENASMRPETLYVVAEAYGTDPKYILWGESISPSPAAQGAPPIGQGEQPDPLAQPSGERVREARGASGEPKTETRGERIRRFRGKRSLSQIARAVGATKASVSKWENGNSVDIQLGTFFKLADALGAEPRELATGEKGQTTAAVVSPALGPAAFVRMYMELPDDVRSDIRTLIDTFERVKGRRL